MQTELPQGGVSGRGDSGVAEEPLTFSGNNYNALIDRGFWASFLGLAAHWLFLPRMPTGRAMPTLLFDIGLSAEMLFSMTVAASA